MCPPAQRPANDTAQEVAMLRYAVIFFIIALIAALFGFGGIAAGAAGIAKILFMIFVVLFVVSLFWGLVAGRG
ncbi:probable signal peptide protein [Ralstonia pseudosolanacearum GMI1000]|nr:probable signal peptide protein [Ralstonia pseudosolanacearum GMI1000]